MTTDPRFSKMVISFTAYGRDIEGNLIEVTGQVPVSNPGNECDEAAVAMSQAVADRGLYWDSGRWQTDIDWDAPNWDGHFGRNR